MSSDTVPSASVPCVTQHSPNSLKLKISFSGNTASGSSNEQLPSGSRNQETKYNATDAVEVTSRTLVKVLNEVHTQLVRRDSRKIFANPVTDEIAAGYSQIIAHPMDLGTIFNRLHSRTVYKTATDYMADVALMCDNAMIYNLPDTIYYQRACKLLLFGRKLLAASSLRKLTPKLGLRSELSEAELGQFCLTGELPQCYVQLQSSCARRLMGQDTSGNSRGGATRPITPSPRIQSVSPLTEQHPPKYFESPSVDQECSMESDQTTTETQQLSPTSTPVTTSLCSTAIEQEVLKSETPSTPIKVMPTSTPADAVTDFSSATSMITPTPPARRPRGRPRKYPRPDTGPPIKKPLVALAPACSPTSSRLQRTIQPCLGKPDSVLDTSNDLTSSSITSDQTSFTDSEKSRTMSPTSPVTPVVKPSASTPILPKSPGRKKRIDVPHVTDGGSLPLFNRVKRHAPESPYSLKYANKKPHKFTKPTDTSPVKRRKYTKREPIIPLKRKVENSESSEMDDSTESIKSVDDVLIQAQQAAAAAAERLRSKYASITSSSTDSPIGPRVVHLNLNTPGKVTAVACREAQSKWSVSHANSQAESSPVSENSIPINYPPVLVHCLTGMRPSDDTEAPAEAAKAKSKTPLLDPPTAEYQEAIRQLEKLKYNSDDPVAAAIHGPLSVFSSTDMIRLSDVYGSDLTTIEYAYSLLKFVQPMGRWARRWAAKKLDVATDGLHSALARFSQAAAHAEPAGDRSQDASYPPERSWPETVGLTIDSPTPPSTPFPESHDFEDDVLHSSFLEGLLPDKSQTRVDSIPSCDIPSNQSSTADQCALDPDGVTPNTTNSSSVPILSSSPTTSSSHHEAAPNSKDPQPLHRNPLELLIESPCALSISSDSVLKSVLHSPVCEPPVNSNAARLVGNSSASSFNGNHNSVLIKSLPVPVVSSAPNPTVVDSTKITAATHVDTPSDSGHILVPVLQEPIKELTSVHQVDLDSPTHSAVAPPLSPEQPAASSSCITHSEATATSFPDLATKSSPSSRISELSPINHNMYSPSTVQAAEPHASTFLPRSSQSQFPVSKAEVGCIDEKCASPETSSNDVLKTIDSVTWEIVEASHFEFGGSVVSGGHGSNVDLLITVERETCDSKLTIVQHQICSPADQIIKTQNELEEATSIKPVSDIAMCLGSCSSPPNPVISTEFNVVEKDVEQCAASLSDGMTNHGGNDSTLLYTQSLDITNRQPGTHTESLDVAYNLLASYRNGECDSKDLISFGIADPPIGTGNSDQSGKKAICLPPIPPALGPDNGTQSLTAFHSVCNPGEVPTDASLNPPSVISGEGPMTADVSHQSPSAQGDSESDSVVVESADTDIQTHTGQDTHHCPSPTPVDGVVIDNEQQTNISTSPQSNSSRTRDHPPVSTEVIHADPVFSVGLPHDNASISEGVTGDTISVDNSALEVALLPNSHQLKSEETGDVQASRSLPISSSFIVTEIAGSFSEPSNNNVSHTCSPSNFSTLEASVTSAEYASNELINSPNVNPKEIILSRIAETTVTDGENLLEAAVEGSPGSTNIDTTDQCVSNAATDPTDHCHLRNS